MSEDIDSGIPCLQAQNGKALLQVSKHTVTSLLHRSTLDAGTVLSVLAGLGVVRAPPLYRPVAQLRSVALGALACVGGGLHGVALALRKRCSASDVAYHAQFQWWVSFMFDGLASLLIWPAMPVICVELLMPLVLVPQLAVSYSIGCVLLGESFTTRRQMGLIFSIIGTLGLSFCTPAKAENFDIDMFWARGRQPNFLVATAGCVALILLAFCVTDASVSWAFLAAFAEAMQYILTRAVAKMFFGDGADLSNPTILCVFVAKALIFLLIIRCQQCGLSASQGLSGFSGVYLISTVLLTCTNSAAFFGDSIVFCEGFVVSAMCTAFGVCLLVQPDPAGPLKEKDGSPIGRPWFMCPRRSFDLCAQHHGNQ